MRTFQYFKVTSDFVFRSITPKILSVYCVFKIKRGYATTQFIGQLSDVWAEKQNKYSSSTHICENDFQTDVGSAASLQPYLRVAPRI